LLFQRPKLDRNMRDCLPLPLKTGILAPTKSQETHIRLIPLRV
jgi:hypothetical protein